MGKVVKAVTKAVVKEVAKVVAVADPKAGKTIAKQADVIGNKAQLFTAQAGKGLADAANATGKWVEKGVSKDGAITNFVQDYVPAGGFVTAIFHAAAGNEDYAQYAAVKGVSTTIVAGAAVVGSLGGPAGAVLAGGLAGAAASAWEGGMKTVLQPSVKGKLNDLTVEGVLISAATGAAGAALGVGAGKLAGAAGSYFRSGATKTITSRSAAAVQFTRPRANAIVAKPLNKIVPLWQFMTPKQKLAAGGTFTAKQILKGSGVGALKETAKSTGLTAAGLGSLAVGPESTALTALQNETKKKKVLAAALFGGFFVLGGGFLLNDIRSRDDSTTVATPATTIRSTTSLAATTAPSTVAVTTAPTAAATTVAVVVASTTATTTKTTTKATTPATSPPPPTAAPATAPGAPTGVIAVPGDCQITVSFTPPASDGGSPITYTVSGGDGPTGGATSQVVTISEPGNYSYTVTATNAVGTGPASAPSNVVIIDGCSG